MTAIAIVGAGSVSFTRTLVSDLLQQEVTRECELCLYDLDDAASASATELVTELREQAKAPGPLRRATSLAEAVDGADYVITTILAGGRSAALGDFELTGRYGLRYTVGDTLGVAGIARAMRAIPALVEIARTCATHAPDGLLLNYTNPMGMLVTAVARAVGYPMVGLCHSADYTARTVARYLEIPPAELEWWSGGINHLAWMLRLSRDKADLYPELVRRAARPELFVEDPVRFDLMARFGLFVTESSKHVAEYLGFYIDKAEEIERLAVPVGEFLSRRPVPIAEQLKNERAGGLLRPPSNEYAPAVIAAAEAGTDYCFQANVMNGGLIENLPAHVAVEVPTVMSRGQLAPVRLGALPSGPAALCRQQMGVQDLAVDAVLNGDRDLLTQAVLLDPQASAVLTVRRIDQLVAELIDADHTGVTYATANGRGGAGGVG